MTILYYKIKEDNMKKAFTMIELIFVIVIIGILAAVATPKLTGIFNQAKAQKITAYAGTLQRTTIPPYWSQSLVSGTSGEINATAPDTETYDLKIRRDLPYPTDFDGTGAQVPSFVTANLEAPSFDFNTTSTPTKFVAISQPLNGITYKLVCTNGNRSTAPKCDVWDGSKWVLASNR